MVAAAVLFWLLASSVVGVVAGPRGRSRLAWFTISLLISPVLALILIVGLPPPDDHPGNARAFKTCPVCAERVRRDASICRYCRYEFSRKDAAALRRRDAAWALKKVRRDNAIMAGLLAAVAIPVLVAVLANWDRVPWPGSLASRVAALAPSFVGTPPDGKLSPPAALSEERASDPVVPAEPAKDVPEPRSTAAIDPQAMAIPGDWEMREEISDVDGSRNVFLRLSSKEPLVDKLGTAGRLLLIVACREGATSVWIVHSREIAPSDTGRHAVTYRIDKQPVQTVEMHRSSDTRALGLWSGADSIPWIRRLTSGQSLSVHALPFSSSPIVADFRIAGLSEVIGPLRESCHW